MPSSTSASKSIKDANQHIFVPRLFRLCIKIYLHEERRRLRNQLNESSEFQADTRAWDFILRYRKYNCISRLSYRHYSVYRGVDINIDAAIFHVVVKSSVYCGTGSPVKMSITGISRWSSLLICRITRDRMRFSAAPMRHAIEREWIIHLMERWCLAWTVVVRSVSSSTSGSELYSVLVVRRVRKDLHDHMSICST